MCRARDATDRAGRRGQPKHDRAGPDLGADRDPDGAGSVRDNAYRRGTAGDQVLDGRPDVRCRGCATNVRCGSR